MTNLETLQESLFNKIKAGSIRVLQELHRKGKGIIWKMVLIYSLKNVSNCRKPIINLNLFLMLSLLKQPVCADCTDNEESHFKNTLIILPIREFISIHYLWRLSQKYPEIYEKFMNELFDRKHRERGFNAAA